MRTHASIQNPFLLSQCWANVTMHYTSPFSSYANACINPKTFFPQKIIHRTRETTKVHSLIFKTSFLFWVDQGMHSPSFRPGKSIYSILLLLRLLPFLKIRTQKTLRRSPKTNLLHIRFNSLFFCPLAAKIFFPIILFFFTPLRNEKHGTKSKSN